MNTKAHNRTALPPDPVDVDVLNLLGPMLEALHALQQILCE
jgi:hypothetical protein